jgi:hypothetical protein
MGYQCIYNANRLHEDIIQRRCSYLSTYFAKKWNKIRMKQLAGGKHMEKDCFPRTLKFKMLGFES